MVVASLILVTPVAWLIAPRLQARVWTSASVLSLRPGEDVSVLAKLDNIPPRHLAIHNAGTIGFLPH